MPSPKVIRLRETNAPDDGRTRKVHVLVLAQDDAAGLAAALEAGQRVWDVEAPSRREATALLELALRPAPDKKKDRAGHNAWEDACAAVKEVGNGPRA